MEELHGDHDESGRRYHLRLQRYSHRVFLGDGHSPFQLELTGLRGRTQPYDLGEGEFHLAFSVPDMDAAHAKHAAMGCICFENPGMGIYFIEDPDGYWIEIVPEK